MTELASEVAALSINNSDNDSAAAPIEESSKQLAPEELVAMEKRLNLTHPLQHKWKLHYFKMVPGGKWEDGMHELAEFNTVEDFFSLYIKIIKPSLLSVNRDFYMFKSHIKPMWEDPQNVHGGRWTFVVKNHDVGVVDECWEQMLFAVLGEAFGLEDGERICGIVASVKKQGHKLNLWTNDCTDQKMNERIGAKLKELCGLKDNIRYEDHQSVQKGRSATTKYMYSV